MTDRMNEYRSVSVDGLDLIVNRYNIIGCPNWIETRVYERGEAFGTHSSWFSSIPGHDGEWFGELVTRRLPSDLDAMPRGTARIDAVLAYVNGLEVLANRAIRAAGW